MALGLDYSAGRISGRTIRNAGYTFAVRYVGTPGRTKNITRSEFQDLVANGVTTWLVYEHNTEDAVSGFNGGVNAARAARADANNIGYPQGGVIFFCADRHLLAREIPAALAYLDGAASVLGRGAVGAYGFSEFINAAKGRGAAAYYWQCGSRSTVGGGVHIYQRNNGYANVGGIQCDVNDLLIPIGPGAPPAPAPTAPGGIETLGFNDRFRDHAGNEQTTLSWMDHQDQSRLYQDAKVTALFELVRKYVADQSFTVQLPAHAEMLTEAVALPPKFGRVTGDEGETFVSVVAGETAEIEALYFVEDWQQDGVPGKRYEAQGRYTLVAGDRQSFPVPGAATHVCVRYTSKSTISVGVEVDAKWK